MATLKHVYEKYVSKANTCVLPSYYKAFDYRYAGFVKKRITFIAGRPLSGKSWFLCNVAINIAKHNNKVLFITKKSKLIHKILFYSSYYFRSLSAVEFITR